MKTYLVGGAVRDQLLQYPYHERDWVVVGAKPEELLAKGFQAVGKDFPVFLHPENKEEYALARTERKTGKGYTGFVCYSSPDVTLEQDLIRRDLTINAMAQDNDGSIIDPYGGQADLKNKLLRHVSEAFTEDPLRVLRTARFYARYAHLGFRIAEETLQLMGKIATTDELQQLSPERVAKELMRALNEPSPEGFIKALKQCGALALLFPEWIDLPKEQLDQLKQLAQTKKQGQQLFACLCQHLSQDSIEQLCQRLKLPGSWQELAQLTATYGKEYSDASNNAEQLYQRLESLDAFRRQERLQLFCDNCQQFYPPANGITQLLAALTISQGINAKALAQQGLKGKAIGQALRKQRINAIEAQL